MSSGQSSASGLFEHPQAKSLSTIIMDDMWCVAILSKCEVNVALFLYERIHYIKDFKSGSLTHS